MSETVRKLCVCAVGVALFAVLSLCLQVPVFENYYLCLGYAVVAVYACFFDPVSAAVTGCLGAAAYCLAINGLRGMPGWALGNIAVGLILGFAFRAAHRARRPLVRILILIFSVPVSVLAGILVIKSAVESLLYAQPLLVRAGKNLPAFIADAVTLFVSLPLCAALDRPVRKRFPFARAS